MKKVILSAAACFTLVLGATAQTDSTSYGDDTDVMESTAPQDADRATYDDTGYPTTEDNSSAVDPGLEGVDAAEPDYSSPDATTPESYDATEDALDEPTMESEPMTEPDAITEPDPNGPN